jgi:hypothetical protein
MSTGHHFEEGGKGMMGRQAGDQEGGHGWVPKNKEKMVLTEVVMMFMLNSNNTRNQIGSI